MKKKTRLMFAMSALALASSAAHAQFYNLAGTQMKTVTGLSFDGTKAVGSGSATNGTAYTKWTAATGVSSMGGVYVSGKPRISDDGNMALINAVNPVTGNTELASYNWANGATTPLGNIGGSSQVGPAIEASSGWGLSGNGLVAVGNGWVNGGSSAHAVVAVGGTITDLGSSVAGSSSRAQSANYTGSVIVGSQDAYEGYRQGAVWTNGVQTLLDDGHGNFLAEALDVNASGQWVVGGGTYQLPGAYRWSAATGYQSLGTLHGVDGEIATATAISDDGSVIVGFDRFDGSPGTQGFSFIWTASLGMMDLTTYATSLGYNLGTVRLAGATSISGDGMTIGGFTSSNTGFILNLGTSPVPEPGTLLLMGLGIGALLLKRRGAVSAAA